MELLTATKEQIFDLFNSGLEKQINSEGARHYIAKVMTDMVDFKTKLNEDEAIGMQIWKAYDKDIFLALSSLRTIADSLLFICGFFPEYFVNVYKRRTVGLDYYLEEGKTAYNSTGHILTKKRALKLSPGLMFELSDNFVDYTNAIFNFRNSLNEGMVPKDVNILRKLYSATKNKAILNYEQTRNLRFLVK